MTAIRKLLASWDDPPSILVTPRVKKSSTSCLVIEDVVSVGMITRQIIATSHDLTPNGTFWSGNLLFQKNLGWWKIHGKPRVFQKQILGEEKKLTQVRPKFQSAPLKNAEIVTSWKTSWMQRMGNLSVGLIYRCSVSSRPIYWNKLICIRENAYGVRSLDCETGVCCMFTYCSGFMLQYFLVIHGNAVVPLSWFRVVFIYTTSFTALLVGKRHSWRL